MEYYVKRVETKIECWSRKVEAPDEECARARFDDEWLGASRIEQEPDEVHVVGVDYLVDPA